MFIKNKARLAYIYRRFDLSALNIIANALNETSTNGTVQQSSSEKLYDKRIFK